MSFKVLLLILITFSSCQKKEVLSKDKLIGKWMSVNKDSSSIILEINKNTVSRLENNKKIIYTDFSISGDTLIMMNNRFKERHLIEILTNTKLQLGAINSYQKDIELIDAIEFVKH